MLVKYFDPDGTDRLVELEDAPGLPTEPAVDLEAEADARIDRVSWTIWGVGILVLVLLVILS